jgi:hypothetical protein
MSAPVSKISILDWCTATHAIQLPIRASYVYGFR